MSNEQFANLIFTNKKNFKVLRHLSIVKQPLAFHKSEQDDYKFYEGLAIMWDKDAQNILEEHKWMLNHYGVLVCPNCGEIYAFIWGQYEVALKLDFLKNRRFPSVNLRFTKNADGIETDFRSLGRKWVHMQHFIDDNRKQFDWSCRKYSCKG